MMLDIQNGSRNLQCLGTNLTTEICHQCIKGGSDLKVKVLVDSFLQDEGKVLVDSPLMQG